MENCKTMLESSFILSHYCLMLAMACTYLGNNYHIDLSQKVVSNFSTVLYNDQCTR